MSFDIEATRSANIHGYVIVDLLTTKPLIRGTNYIECFKEQQIQRLMHPSMKLALVPCDLYTYQSAGVPEIEN